MAYVDHTFSITDEDEEAALEGTFIAHNRFPLRDVALALLLLTSGTLFFILGLLLLFDDDHHKPQGIIFTMFACGLFFVGFYYTRIAFYAYKGYKNFTFTNMQAL